MMSIRSLAVFALLAAPAGLADARPATRHVAVDWADLAVATPEGGIRIGNPRAKVQLVEYGSFTCPHCAAFAKEAFPQIRDRYVRTGRLSFEFRGALRDSADLVAAVVSRCGGPTRFFGNALAVFGAQDDWERRAIEYEQSRSPDARAQTRDAVLTGLAQGSGLADIAARRGIGAGQLDACLRDAALRDTLSNAAADAWNVRQIGGTPAFYLGGDKLDGTYGWAALEPYLRAAFKN